MCPPVRRAVKYSGLRRKWVSDAAVAALLPVPSAPA